MNTKKIALTDKFEYIKSDLYRYYGKVTLKNFLKAMLRNKSFKYQFWMRMCQIGGICKIIARPIYELKKGSNIQIDYRTKIGYGLYIAHGGPIVVNPSAVIGNNCNLSQYTTIGSNDGHAAVLGDNVYIGPNVCLVEDVVIGNNVTIGAGSVVTKNIPDNATAVGNYAKVVN